MSTRVPLKKSTVPVRRILESFRAGAFLCERSSAGWVVHLSDDSSSRLWAQYLVPFGALRSRNLRWLQHRLIRSFRRSLDAFEGVQLIPGSKASQLVNWLVRGRRVIHRGKNKRRWTRADAMRLARTTQRGGYMAERSRRGWVVRLSSDAGRLRGHYLVPFRALRQPRRRWYGGALIAGLRKSLTTLSGVRRISPSQVARLFPARRNEDRILVGQVWARK